jgi:hypothetical protein
LHLARDSSQGDIQPGRGWLYDKDSYNTTITLYILLAPLAIFKLMQRKLTLFDLTLDSAFNNHYFIAKALYRSFLHDYKLAYIDPKLEYDAENAASDESIKNRNPEKYQKQGLYSGILDTVTDTLIISENNGGSENILRIMNYGEFLDKYFKDEALKKPFSNISYLFYKFHPKTRPVLWRILVAQAFIYRLIIETYKKKAQSVPDISDEISKMLSEDIKDVTTEFDWRSKEEKEENIPLIKVQEPIETVKKYLKDIVLREYQEYWE